MSVIQVIDENKRFSQNLNEYFEKSGVSKAGLNYDVIAVFGSQSTGKSTLLNALFGTEFGVMDATAARKQTTKGIWMGIEKNEPQLNSANIDSPVKERLPLVVLDVEGTDGRERGEDQDFERKAALFALATSEILLINMWEHQVGLYVGANMALLRTVFEVNLSLFQAGRGEHQRSRILFVIRDHLAITPLDTLAKTLRDDLEAQWEALAKPEGLEDSKISDFFDLEFSTLPHKLLAPADFSAATVQLREQLGKSFKPEYRRQVPIDGWPMYAEQVWQQIEMNKDLDLPTHQILVARFRCDEIAAQAFAEFEAAIAALSLPFGEATAIIPEFGSLLRKERSAALKTYDEIAGRYHESVYNERRLEVLGRVDGVLTAYFGAQLTALKAEALNSFRRLLKAPQGLSSLTNREGTDSGTGVIASSSISFKDRVAAAAQTARSEFEAAATESVIDSSFYSYSVYLEELNTELELAAAQARDAELRRLMKSISKTIALRLDPIELHFDQFPSRVQHPWDAVKETLANALASVRGEYSEDFGLGGSSQEIQEFQSALECLAWRELASRVAAMSKTDVVLQKLRDRFEDSFKYTEDGLPVVWSPGDDIDAAAVEARKHAFLLLPVLSSAKLANGEFLTPPRDVIESLKAQEEDVPDFVILLPAQQQQDIERRFQRVADAAFVDAKRSVMQLQTHIPAYIFVILAVLGWNEFTMVLRNPLLMLLVLMFGGAAYVVHTMGMTNTILNILEGSFARGVAEFKEFLRKILLTEDERLEKPYSSDMSKRRVSMNSSSNSDSDATSEKPGRPNVE